MEGVYWTLILEVVFYGIVAALIWAGRFSKIDVLAKALTIYSGVAIIICLAAQFTDSSAVHWIANLVRGKRQILAWHGVFFALGIYFYLWSDGRPSRSYSAFSLVTFALCCLQIYVAAAFPQRLDDASTGSVKGVASWLPPLLVFSAFTSIIPVSIIYKERIATLVSHKSGMIIRTLGLMSYPVYLIHFTLGVVLIREMVVAGIAPVFALGLAAFALIGLSFVIAKYWEPPIQRWLKARLSLPKKGQSATARNEIE